MNKFNCLREFHFFFPILLKLNHIIEYQPNNQNLNKANL